MAASLVHGVAGDHGNSSRVHSCTHDASSSASGSCAADLAAQVRRAAAGHRIVVTVGGRAAATLGPLETAPDGDGRRSTPSSPPASSSRPGASTPAGAAATRPPVPIWSGVRLDRALRELRG